MRQLRTIWKDLGLCGIVWDHLESFGFMWVSSGSIWDHVGSSAIIWGHMCPSRLTWDRLVSSWIRWDHPDSFGPLGGTIWGETSEERHLEGFWEGLSQLIRKHHSATICKTSPQSQYRRLFSKVSIRKYCTWSGLDANHRPECTKHCACAYKAIPKHDESETLEESIFIKCTNLEPFAKFPANINFTTCFRGGYHQVL